MTVEQQHSGGERAQRPRPTRAQRIVAAAFLGAFGLTMLTVLLTGLAVRAPRSGTNPYAPPPAAAAERVEPLGAAAPRAAPAAAPEAETRARKAEDAANAAANGSREPASAGEGSEPLPADDR